MTWERNGYTLRPARREEGDAYFRAGFDPMDPEVVRLTGSQKNFTREEVLGFFLACFDDPDRRDFLLLDPAGKIIGESTINEIDWDHLPPGVLRTGDRLLGGTDHPGLRL